MFSSDVDVLKLVSVVSNSSSGSGESRNNSSTEGVSAPEGKWNQSEGRVPSFLLMVSLNKINRIVNIVS